MDVSTPSCHYKPLFGAGDSEASAPKGIARFGEMTVDPGGASQSVTYPREEQISPVEEGAGELQYAGESMRCVETISCIWRPAPIKVGEFRQRAAAGDRDGIQAARGREERASVQAADRQYGRCEEAVGRRASRVHFTSS